MGITGIAGMMSMMDNYSISSIHGNPYSMNPVERIGRDSSGAGKALVIAAKKPEKDLYVKDFGSLENTKSTATGDFADMLGIQENMMNVQDNVSEASSDSGNNYSSYLNDTIGMMGFQNRLRDQLNGAAFTPFA